MIQLKPTNLWAADASKNGFDLNNIDNPLLKNFLILGYVTSDAICFEVSQLFKQVERPQKGEQWISYPVFGNEKQYAATPQESLYSLLEVNGLFFKNKWSDERPSPTFDGDSWEYEDVRIWETFQKGVVKKLLILKAI